MAKAKSSTKNSDSELAIPREKPTLRVDDKDCPGLKDWKIDQEVTLTIKGRVAALSHREYNFDNDDRRWATVKIQSVTSEDGDALAKGMDSVKPQNVRK